MGVRNRSKSSRGKVRAHRNRLRQQGLRPIQIWVPDLRLPAFVEEAHRQFWLLPEVLMPGRIRTLSMPSPTGAGREAGRFGLLLEARTTRESPGQS
jgi:Protein  of unknown function (DUF3018)